MHPHADSVRGFNRFYTKQIGLLRKGYLDSAFSLAEVRVLYELVHRKHPIAADIAKELDLDAGYLSRLLAKFEKRGLISRKASGTDGRQSHLALTKRGRQAFAPLEVKTQKQVAAMLNGLCSADQQRLVDAMHTIEQLLGAQPQPERPYTLRTHRPGDMGWVVHRHGALYAAEYGWDESFEGLTAGIVAKFIQNFDAQRERCWIAERDGAILGCIFLVKKSDRIAKLRLLLVEPSARGLGLGKRLVEECISFAREAGYRKMTLWTQSNLNAARHIYASAGFRLVKQEPAKQFGYEMMTETWDLKL
ncbi:MAG TPA: bifunctional helix-turn-helix transcriptional regulator/GNAT family N-acetyltransferase [Bryobacteraceae bacterium]|jgi:DNA-binding MarR family transcriptional regulator/N-acetylglutamate synthase-like GNAT family acetyltransferase|nr:bifunctional helix-turn-helix transcriptional regulator/GNAT family N-acetyltransferase [Bryobacteraceae bacterium]